MTNETLYSIALSSIEGIGPCRAKEFVRVFGSAEALYHLSPYDMVDKGITPNALRLFLENKDKSLAVAEKEMLQMERLGIQCYNYFDDNYPLRLRQCDDSPLVLYTNNLIDLSRDHYVAIVGTRKATDYGRSATRSFVKELAERCPDVTIVSGLAYGIDINAQRAALEFGLRTVGVVAHGLHTLYPSAHRATAQTLTAQGGAVLSEYPTSVGPAPKNFLQRNRIVAGLSDCVLVMESAVQGGSISTVSHALNYNRDVFAYPGRVSDPASEGCNHLIQTSKARLATSAGSVLKAMGWGDDVAAQPVAAAAAAESYSPEETAVLSLLRQGSEPLQIAVLMQKSGIPMHKLRALLTKLEFKGAVTQLAGEKYKII